MAAEGGEEKRGGGKVCETDWEEKALLPRFQARFYLPDPPPPPSQTWGSFILSAENKRGNIGPRIKGKRGLKRRERGPKGKGRGDPKENGTKKKGGHTHKKKDRGPPQEK